MFKLSLISWLSSNCFFTIKLQPNPGLPSTNHRRVACSFRDQSLFQIFQISINSLHRLKDDGSHGVPLIFLWPNYFLLTMLINYLFSTYWLKMQPLVGCKNWHFLFRWNVYHLILLERQLMKVQKSLVLFRYFLFWLLNICILTLA